MLALLALLIACGALVLAAIAAQRLRACERDSADITRLAVAAANIATAARRVDDRLTYYEHRNLGLKQLRVGYDKQIAKKRAEVVQVAGADVAPEGTAQSERLIG